MSDILKQIVTKRLESSAQRFSSASLEKLKQSSSKREKPRSFFAALSNTPQWSIIAEIKASSPSKGTFLTNPNPLVWGERYERLGANAISIVTEENFFLGKPEWLNQVKQVSTLPILRKDFLTTPEDILECHALGADAVLLIVAMLKLEQLRSLCKEVFSYGMEPLVEVHTREELEMALQTETRVIGINNRNLKDFSVTLETTKQLLPLVRDRLVVSESGFSSHEQLKELHQFGVKTFLIGESILMSRDPEATLSHFIAK